MIGAGRVLAGITNWPAYLVEHRHIHVTGDGEIKLWTLTSAKTAMAYRVATALANAGLGGSAAPLVTIAIWAKVIVNAALNDIWALTRMTVGWGG
ncbi:hypothetical protein GTZ99_00875 [Novosphingobium sp. FSY-8]|uniref:Uncharacterized protein n=1 Tax=Novosphingobium ovatum TaxID=1908523 RepID=A0ABW9X9B0_9SPHN|nr:hypothetical protein [Novosphingobium ovatum]NBC35107.1 hypothetical protein [Novosphingobium ovatum]